MHKFESRYIRQHRMDSIKPKDQWATITQGEGLVLPHSLKESLIDLAACKVNGTNPRGGARGSCKVVDIPRLSLMLRHRHSCCWFYFLLSFCW